MEWYYAAGRQQKGPVSDPEFQRLIQEGTIHSTTMVWREGMADWQPFRELSSPKTDTLPKPAIGTVLCANCSQSFPPSEVVAVGDKRYCATCKPIVIQRMKEGAPLDSSAETVRREFIRHEASVKSISLLYFLGGVILSIWGVLMFTASILGASKMLEYAILNAMVAALGVFELWVAVDLRKLKKWTRIPIGILSGLGLLAFPGGTIINGYILYLVFSQKGRMVFSDEYKEIIAQTPGVKYRTPLLVWIFLGIIILIVIGVVGSAVYGASSR